MAVGGSARLRRTQQGIALLVVLWACTLLAILLGGFATLARTQATQARYLSSRAQLRYLAEAGVTRALAEVTAKDGGQWVSDGRPYRWAIDGQPVEIRIVDELGKIDINVADKMVLCNLFVNAGLTPADAAVLAANIAESRDPSGAFNRQEGTQRYLQAGLSQGPRYAQFNSPDEIQTVLGMTPALYRKIAPVLTVWSHRSMPAPAFAPPLALASLPGMDAASAARFASMRLALNRKMPPPVLPNGMPMGNMRGGNVKTILTSASGADGIAARISVTLRIERVRSRGSYTILRWQEDAMN